MNEMFWRGLVISISSLVIFYGSKSIMKRSDFLFFLFIGLWMIGYGLTNHVYNERTKNMNRVLDQGWQIVLVVDSAPSRETFLVQNTIQGKIYRSYLQSDGFTKWNLSVPYILNTRCIYPQMVKKRP